MIKTSGCDNPSMEPRLNTVLIKSLKFEEPDTKLCSIPVYAQIIIVANLDPCFWNVKPVQRPESTKIQVGDEVFIHEMYIKTQTLEYNASYWVVIFVKY